MVLTSQPCFLVLAAAATDVTGDGTDYTMVWTTEVFDQGNNFASNTFTAPVTGHYFLQAGTRLTGIATVASPLSLSIVTSNKTYFFYDQAATKTGTGAQMSVIADMDAGDTATVHAYVATGSKVVDIGGEDYSFFSGYKLP